MNLFYQPLIPQGSTFLNPEESRHCIKVLRKKTGDHIQVTDGQGFFYDAIIATADARQCTFTIASTKPELKRKFHIHIAISPTKNADRMEWFVEKAVELGVDKITFMDCRNSERVSIRQERMEKIAVTAMKQSLKASLPIISGMVKFNDLVSASVEDQKFIAFVDPSNPVHLKELAKPSTGYVVLIGPEGDFDQAELTTAQNKGFTKVSLGASRLRTETAGLVACHTLHLINP